MDLKIRYAPRLSSANGHAAIVDQTSSTPYPKHPNREPQRFQKSFFQQLFEHIGLCCIAFVYWVALFAERL